MTTRRWFLGVCGASTAGISLTKIGRIEIPRGMVRQVAGTCLFCRNNRREVFGIVGICDDCAEDMRKALARLTPNEATELRARYGVG